MRLLRGWLLVAALTGAAAAPLWGQSGGLPGESDTGRLVVSVQGTQVRASFSAPAVALVGFDRAPAGAQERSALALARENLETGDGLVRFAAAAGCRLVEARVDGNPAPGRGETAGRLGADWRFVCERPERLGSAALGVFVGFPALARVHVTYGMDLGGTDAVRGEAVATRANPVVSFVPLG